MVWGFYISEFPTFQEVHNTAALLYEDKLKIKTFHNKSPELIIGRGVDPRHLLTIVTYLLNSQRNTAS